MTYNKFCKYAAIGVVLFILIIVLLHFWQRHEMKRELAELQEISALALTQQEIDLINEDLNRRNALDCKIERTWYGFACREFKTGKLYRVYSKLNKTYAKTKKSAM